MTTVPKAIYRFNAISIKIPSAFFFCGTRMNNFKICMETQTPRIAKAILREKNRAGGLSLPDFRVYYKATVIKAVWD